MTDNEKEVFQKFLSKTLNITPEEVVSLYNETGELTNVDLLLQKDSERVANYKKAQSDQFKLGEKKAHEKVEKHLREKYEIADTELIGAELIDFVFETQTAELKEKLGKKIDVNDIEKHPAFIAKRNEWEKNLKAKDTEWEEKLNAQQSEWNRKQTLAQVSKAALLKLETDFILPENAQRAAALKDVLIREIENGNYSLQDNGEPIILDKEGKPLEDAHGKMISFKDYTEGLASKFFDKRQANQRSNAANQQQQQSGQAIIIKNQDDFRKASLEAKTPEEQVAVMKAAREAGIVK